MDNSQQYIKMCFGAWPHLKGNYQPVKGDFYKCSCKSCQDTDRIFMVNDYDYDYVMNRNLENVYERYAEMVKDSGCGGFGAYWDKGGKEKRGFFIIWKQDQLQEMMLPELRKQQKYTHEGFIAACLIADFDSWLNRMFPWIPPKQCNSMEQLWIGFVMHEKYHKIWNGEDWKAAGIAVSVISCRAAGCRTGSSGPRSTSR